MRPLGSILVVILATFVSIHLCAFGLYESTVFFEYMIFVVAILFFKRKIPFNLFSVDFLFYGGGCSVITLCIIILISLSVGYNDPIAEKVPSVFSLVFSALQQLFISTSYCAGDEGMGTAEAVTLVALSTTATAMGTGCSTDWCLKFFQSPPNLLKSKTHRSMVYVGIMGGAYLGFLLGRAATKGK